MRWMAAMSCRAPAACEIFLEPGEERLQLVDTNLGVGHRLRPLAVLGVGLPAGGVIPLQRAALDGSRLFLLVPSPLPRGAQLGVGAGEDVQTPIAQLPYLGRQMVDQVAVVRHQQDGAVEMLEHLLQDLLGRDVQVVARLVEEQEVGPFQREHGQRQPPSFAPAECPHRLEDVVAAEQVLGQVVARLSQQHVLVTQQLVQDGAVGVQPFVGLRKVADLQAGAEAQLPRSGSSWSMSVRRKVVLPLPFGPMSAATSPRSRMTGSVVNSVRPG